MGRPIVPGVSAAGLLEDVARIAPLRLLADVHDSGGGESARHRLETALGLDFAERLVDALSSEALDRLGVAPKSPPFAALLTGAHAKERSEAVQRDASPRTGESSEVRRSTGSPPRSSGRRGQDARDGLAGDGRSLTA